MPIPIPDLPPKGPVLAGLLVLGICFCRGPQTPPQPPPARPRAAPAPQFTFATWSQALPLIQSGKVVQTVAGRGGLSLILQDHTWVHLVTRPGDPLPKNPLEAVSRLAPNARTMRHTSE